MYCEGDKIGTATGPGPKSKSVIIPERLLFNGQRTPCGDGSRWVEEPLNCPEPFECSR